MTVKGGTSPACAACKYRRRRCSSDCVLAPYFPANQNKAFQNAHRLFGVANIVKILEQLSTEEQKEEAMKSIKYEADMRERYPVYGCAGIICQLRQQLRQAIEELHYVHAQLGVYREQFNYRMVPATTSHSSPSSQLQLGISSTAPPTMDAPLPLVQHHPSAGNEIPFFLTADGFDDHVNTDSSHHLAKPSVGFEPFYDFARNNDSMVATDTGCVYQDFGNISFNATADDRQSYVETKEACESGSESSFRDFQPPIDQVSKIELRNAAACFNLRNIK